MPPRHRATALLACLFILTLFSPPAAPAAGHDSLARGVDLYEQAEFEAAQSALLEAVNSGRLDYRSLAKAYAYLGLVNLARGLEPYALESFGRAKGQDPSFRLDPALFPPAALNLFAQASPIGQPVRPLAAPAPSAAAAPAAPAASLAPPSAAPAPAGQALAPAGQAALPAAPEAGGGYVIEVQRDDVTLDQGARQGVAIGQRFEIIETRKLIHPVTGREMLSQRQVAVVMVVDVQPDLATAKFVSGRMDLLAPGLEAKPLGEAPPAASQPKPPAFQRRPGALLRIMVMGPELNIRGRDPSLDPTAYQAQTLTEHLLRYPKLDAFVPDPALLGPVNRERPSAMAPAMEKMAADAVLFWSVTLPDDSSHQVRLAFSLYPRGADSVSAKDYGMTSTVKAQRQYGPIIAEWVAEELKMDK